MLTVGIDWARRKHDAVLMSSSGEVLERITFTHTSAGFNALVDGIARHEPDPVQTRVGLELHDGALLAWLLDQGYSVYGVNPKSAERARTLYRPSGSKDDQGDAFILAEMVRTNIGRLRSVRASSSVTQELRALVRLRASLVAERASFAQRLVGLLSEWSPALYALCDDLLRVAWQRHLVASFALDEDLAVASPGQLRRFCKGHHLSGKTAARVQAVDLPHRAIPVINSPFRPFTAEA